MHVCVCVVVGWGQLWVRTGRSTLLLIFRARNSHMIPPRCKEVRKCGPNDLLYHGRLLEVC